MSFLLMIDHHIKNESGRIWPLFLWPMFRPVKKNAVRAAMIADSAY